MKLTLIRQPAQLDCTIGRLFVGLKAQCFTLEPGSDFAKGAIPAATYEVQITHSLAFKRPMPLLMNVPGFSGIRIHPGNTDADTGGCILVGTYAELHRIDVSQNAFDNLFKLIDNAITAGEGVTITIQHAQYGMKPLC